MGVFMEKLKILVVDDESRMRKLVKDFLVKSDFDEKLMLYFQSGKFFMLKRVKGKN